MSPVSPRGRAAADRGDDRGRNAAGRRRQRRAPYILRPHQPGNRLGGAEARRALCAGIQFRRSFEALAAEIGSKFLKEFDPKKERAWIAEKDGENVGFVMLVRKTDEMAKLRMLLVDPKARGLGIGKRLVEECIRFAQQRGYRKMTLWTNDILVAAIHIYKQCGFKLVSRGAAPQLRARDGRADVGARSGDGLPLPPDPYRHGRAWRDNPRVCLRQRDLPHRNSWMARRRMSAYADGPSPTMTNGRAGGAAPTAP